MLHVVMFARLRANSGGGAGSSLLSAAQHDGILVQISGPLYGHCHSARLLTHIIAAHTINHSIHNHPINNNTNVNPFQYSGPKCFSLNSNKYTVIPTYQSFKLPRRINL